ncbi:hypothetical protein R3P38DRAFT_2793506 [Favolaschia claudopus]|uniref:Uncharacterized protein n=1 Tax=Favolaschia claudopus TaxID=2862362 RepID=A0AAW0AC49_9AGAR
MTIQPGTTASTQAITLAPNYLIHLACEEWDRIEAEKKKGLNSRAKREDVGDALSAERPDSPHSTSSGLRGERRDQRTRGHVRSKCPSPRFDRNNGGNRNGNGNRNAPNSANAAVDSDEDGAWSVGPVEDAHIDTVATLAGARANLDAVEHVFGDGTVFPGSSPSVTFDSDTASGAEDVRDDSSHDFWPALPDGISLAANVSETESLQDDECTDFDFSDSESVDSMPGLVEVSDDDGEDDVYGFPMAVEYDDKFCDDTEELSGVDCSQCGSLVNVDLDSVRNEDSDFVSERAGMTEGSASTIVHADVPGRADSTQIHLVEVLYAPEVGYTLVSPRYFDHPNAAPHHNRQTPVWADEFLGFAHEHAHEAEDTKLRTFVAFVAPDVAQKLGQQCFVTGTRLVEGSKLNLKVGLSRDRVSALGVSGNH